MLKITLELTVALLLYNLALVSLLCVSILRPSVYNSYALSYSPALKAALPSSFFCIRLLDFYNKQTHRVVCKHTHFAHFKLFGCTEANYWQR